MATTDDEVPVRFTVPFLAHDDAIAALANAELPERPEDDPEPAGHDLDHEAGQ